MSFKRKKLRFLKKWNKLVDWYLNFSDELFETIRQARSRSQSIATESSLVQPQSNSMIKFTILGLLIVFVLVLSSCQTSRNFPPRNNGQFPDNKNAPKPEQIFVKRETQTIRPAESGSKTGSLWNNTQVPRQLFVEPRPEHIGQTITVNIPENLQFRQNQDAPSTPAAGANGASGDTNATQKIDDTVNKLIEPVKSFKMTIVGIEPTGDVYLRGVKQVKSEGADKSVTVFAKVPRRNLSTFDVDAGLITEASVVEESPHQARSEYSAPGWDQIVSRKIAGFVPNMSAESKAIEDARAELVQFQKSLNDRRKAIEDETQRLQKDRERLSLEEQRLRDGNANAADKKADASKDNSKNADKKPAPKK